MFTIAIRELRFSIKVNHIHKTSVRLRHKLKENAEKKDLKLATDVLNYVENTPEICEMKDKLPKSLFRKYKTPESMYLINQNTAKIIAKSVTKHISTTSPIVEVNPGLGILSKELLHHLSNHIYMFELSNHFSQHIGVSMIK